MLRSAKCIRSGGVLCVLGCTDTHSGIFQVVLVRVSTMLVSGICGSGDAYVYVGVMLMLEIALLVLGIIVWIKWGC